MISVCPPGTKTDDPQGRCCVLPFSYGEETFDACTLTGETRLWCSLDAVYAGNFAYCGKKANKIRMQDINSRCVIKVAVLKT